MSKKRSTKAGETQRVLATKWGKPLIDAGYTVLPNAILEHQHKLGLDAVDLAIVVHLARHWWAPERLPYPGKRALAALLRVDERTIQRRIAKMEAAGLLERVERFDAASGSQRTNEYSLSGLIERAKPLAVEMIAEKEERVRKAASRRKPGLRTRSEADE